MIPTFDLAPTPRAAQDWSEGHGYPSYNAGPDDGPSAPTITVQPDQLRVYVAGGDLYVEIRLEGESEDGWAWGASDLKIDPVVAWIVEHVTLLEYAAAIPVVEVEGPILSVLFERTPIAYA